MKARNLEDVYELLPMQQGILFHTLSAPKSGVYLEQLVFSLRGQIDVEVFRNAWQRIVDRHPIMRTSFHWKNLAKPVQVVHRHAQVHVEVIDWSQHEKAPSDALLESWLQADRLAGFDFTQSPQMRITVFKLVDESCRFAWCFPHLIMDGWSVGLVMQEFVNNYKQLWHGEQNIEVTPHSAAPPYRHYLTWWKNQDPANVAPYWVEALAGYSAPAKISVGAAGEVGADEATHERMEITLESVAGDLERFVREHQLTMNTMILAAWGLVLSRYYGVNDLIVGATTASRPSEVDNVGAIVGPMIVSLPIRMNLDPESLLVPWLQALQSQQAEVREHEHGSIVQLREWSELPHSVPLFESIIAYENVPFPELSLSEEGLDILDFVYDGRPQYPVSMVVFPGPDLPLRIVYDRRRFQAPTIKRMLHHVETVLQNMVKHPVNRLKDISYLTSSERQQVTLWGQGSVSEIERNSGVHRLFERKVKTYAGNVAVCGENSSLTYDELNRQANKLARYLLSELQRQGHPVEPVIGVCTDRSSDMVVALLAILKAGGVYLPLDASHPKSRISYSVEDAGAHLVLTQRKLRSLLPDVAAILLDDLPEQVAFLEDDNLDLEVPAENLAYLIYTSGSTGQPKGVMLEHRSLCNMSSAQICAFGVQPCSRVLQMASPGFDASISEIFMALLSGAALVVVPAEQLQPGLPLISTLNQHEISHVTLVPSVLTGLSEVEFPSLQVLISAGEACTAEIIERWVGKCRLFNAYGPTESTVCATFAQLSHADEHAVIGRPIDNVNVYILDPWQNPVAEGVTGELCIGGVGLARGYVGRSDLSEQRFIEKRLAGENKVRLYRTGDLARFRADGQIEFCGRADMQVKIRGCRVEPGEVEHAVARLEGVKQGVVSVGTQASGEKQLWAYIVPVVEGSLSASDVRALLQQVLPEYMLPNQYLFLKDLPLLASGKVDRNALPPPADVERELDESYVPPRNPVEMQLVKIWETLLEVHPIGVKDDFYTLGGHSLMALQLMGKIQSQFAVDVSLTQLHLVPTIEQQAALLQKQDVSTPAKPALVRMKSGTGAPLFCIHPIGGTALCYSELASCIESDQPVYGVQSSGVRQRSLEEMAKTYIALIRKQQGVGPYYLLGWSTGGTLAYEIAQQLHAQDEEVGILALLDPTFLVSGLFPEVKGETALFSLFLKQLTGRSESGRDVHDGGETLTSKNVDVLLQHAQVQGWLPREVSLDQLKNRFDMFKAEIELHQRYQVKSYSGPAAVFVANESVAVLKRRRQQQLQGMALFSNLVCAVQEGGRQTGRSGYHEVPGSHYSMLTKDHAVTLGEQITRCVAQARALANLHAEGHQRYMKSADTANVRKAI